MSTAHQLLHSLVQRQDAAAWAHLWTSTAVLAAALLAARWRRLTPGARESILSLGLAKLLVPGTALLLAVRATGWEPWRASAAPAPDPFGPSVPAGLVAIQPGGSPSELACVLALLWLGGAATAVLVRSIRRRALVGALVRGAEPLRGGDPLSAAASLASEGRARVLRGRGAVPFTFGTLRPVVVLPRSGELEPEIERSLLAHELAHVRRRDDLRAGLTAAVAALFWFHPLVWIAARRLALTRESACDQASASQVGLPAYLAALDHVCRGAIAPAGLTAWASGALRERIDLLMDAQRIRFAPRRVIVTLAALATAAASLASGFAAPLPAPSDLGGYRLDASVEARGEALLVRVELDDTTGAPLTRPELVVRSGEHASLETTTEDGRSVVVRARLDRRGNGSVRARVQDEDEVLFDRTVAIFAPGASSPAASFDPAGPMTFSLRDADLHEVLWTLARVRGLRLSLEGGVEGTVTVELLDVPWSEALDVVTRTNGLRWAVSGDQLVVSTGR